MSKRSVTHTLALLLLAGASLSAQASWYLDGESSRLSFVSTKNANVSEVQRFLVLHGKVDPGGKAEVEVELESVNSRNMSVLRRERLNIETRGADKPARTLTAREPIANV